MRRRAAVSRLGAWAALRLAALCVASFACGDDVRLRTIEDLRPETLFGGAGPAAVVFWAPWSEASLELLPTLAELAEEYADDGVGFATVALTGAAPERSPAPLARFPASARHYSYAADPDAVLASFGAEDLPAVVVYDRAGRVAYTLGPAGSSRGPAPEDIADAIEAVLD